MFGSGVLSRQLLQPSKIPGGILTPGQGKGGRWSDPRLAHVQPPGSSFPSDLSSAKLGHHWHRAAAEEMQEQD